jgi:hypothetical protein
MKKVATLYFCYSMVSYTIYSQQWAGVAGSNYMGSHAAYTNPALITDSRYKVYVNLGAADYFLGNNALKWNAPFGLFNFAKDKAQNTKKYRWQANYVSPTNNQNNKNFNNLFELRGPAIMYTIDETQAVSISSRGQSFINFKNVSSEVASLMWENPNSPFRVRQANDQNLSVNFNNIAEIAGSYAKNISLNSSEAISVGVTLKRIIGLSNFHFIANNSDYQLVTVFDNTGNIIENALNLQQLYAKYGFSDERLGLQDFSFKPGYWLGKPSPGRAIAADIGITYEHRPDIQKYQSRSKGKQTTDLTRNKYKYKVGVALANIGRVKFDNAAYVSNYNTSTQNRVVLENNFSLFPNRRLIDGINQAVGNTNAENTSRFNSHLASTLNIHADYHLKDNYYIYSQLCQNIRLANTVGMFTPSSFSVVPRYESPWLDVSFSVNLVNNYQLLTLGTAMRLGPVFLGSDNLQGLLKIGQPKGSNVFAGASIPILHRNSSKITDCPSFGPGLKPKRKTKKARF